MADDLDLIFREVLGRPVDPDGWMAYKDMEGSEVREILRESEEYKLLSCKRKESTESFRSKCMALFQEDVKCGECFEKFTMVVCRYREDCEWLITLANIFKNCNIILYNRGDQMDHVGWEHPRIHVVPDSNEGNEEVAYLRYIIEHYDALPDDIIFFQPDIDHNPHIIQDIQYGEFPLARCMGYSETMCGDGPPDVSKPPSLVEATIPNGICEDTLSEFLRVSQVDHLPTKFAQAGCFRVSGERVGQVPLKRYRSILQMLVGYFAIHGRVKYKAYGSVMERCWTSLFSH